MSETASTPGPGDEQDGTFVGGTFGRSDEASGQAGTEQTTAQQIEAEQDAEPVHLAGSQAAPAGAQEFVTEPSGSGEELPADVEGTSTEPAPGDRNTPV